MTSNDTALSTCTVYDQESPLQVTVTQITPWCLALDAARETMGKKGLGNEPTNAWKAKLLDCEHSVIRRVRYQIEFENIKSWVSVHLVRHKFGVEHFVRSQRDDRNPDRTVSRDDMPQGSLINHMMDINAAEVMFISRRRLCHQASPETLHAWELVKQAMGTVDPILAAYMVPMCEYRGCVCHELKSCGRFAVSRICTGLEIKNDKA